MFLGTSVIPALPRSELITLLDHTCSRTRLRSGLRRGRQKMSNIIGRFEIISQIAQSSATVYKALDTENQQTVALKVIRLEQMQETDREALVKRVFDEAEQAKALSSHNIAALYGVGDEDGQLLGATEYVQGNSVATTLARKD